MSTDAMATVVAEAAETLREAAREHKRLEAHHKRAARSLMQERAALLARAGIHLEPTTQPEEAQSR